MGIKTNEVRAMLDPERHRKLSAVGFSRKTTMSALVIEAIDMLIAEEIRKAHEGKLLLRMLDDKGIGLETVGNNK